MKKEMISAGKFDELDRLVFDQKITEEDGATFTACLNVAEEVMLAEMLIAGNDKALAFLKKYQQHYTLSNEAVNLLIKKIADERVRNFLKQEFELYGYNEEQGVAVCKAINVLDADFLLDFAMSGRVYYERVYAELRIASEDKDGFGKVYRQAIENRKA